MHLGQNIARIRLFQRIKQEDMASRLKISQQAYSKIERSEGLADELIDKIAAELGCTPEVLKALESTPYVQSFNQSGGNVIGCQFNPIEKIVQLYDEKIALYERMLKEKNELLEFFVKNKHKQVTRKQSK